MLVSILSPNKMLLFPTQRALFTTFYFDFFTAICNKTSSANKESVISAPTKEKHSIPKSKAPSDITVATHKMFLVTFAIRTLPIMQKMSINTNAKQVIRAVINGVKFA